MSKCIVSFIYLCFNKTKESWEMNSEEKLEQSCIVKEKGTQYFKVSIYTFSIDFMNEGVDFSHFACVYFRKVNTSRRRCSTKRSFHGWNMNLGCRKRMRRRPKHCNWLHISTWPCASSRRTSPTRLWKTVTRYRFHEGHRRHGMWTWTGIDAGNMFFSPSYWSSIFGFFACVFRPWRWTNPMRKLCSAGGRHSSAWTNLKGPKMVSSKWLSCTLLIELPGAR